MDLNSLEIVNVIAQGGADTITVNDLTGTGVGQVSLNLGDTGNGGDGQPDTVIINGTNGNDNVSINGSTVGGASLTVAGLSPQVGIFHTELIDHLTVNTLGGFDRVDTTFLGAGVIGLTVDLGDGQGAAVTTTTALRTLTATAVFGQPVTLTATVTSQAGVRAGTVTFRDGNTVLGTAQLNAAGQAAIAVSLGVGNHALTAAFAGTGGFTGSTSAVATETVSPAATAVTLVSSPNPTATGRAVTFTATLAVVSPGAGTPTGTVTFQDGNVILGTAAVGPGGTATLTTSFAAAGSHLITAVYSGDQNFVGSSHGLTEAIPGDANALVIDQVYRDLLGRLADATGLAAWQGTLAQGMTRTQVVAGIENSIEYQTVVVQKAYQQFLHRSADLAGLNAWLAFLQQGHTVEQLEAGVIGSPECFQARGGGTSNGFLAALYQDALNRGIDAVGQTAFGTALANGATTGQIAAAVLSSLESLQDDVQGFYQHLLGRPADSAGLNGFVNALQQGATDQRVIAAIAGSDEFFANL
jgi:hypothetical protein